MKNKLLEAVKRLELYQETLGGVGNPYVNSEVNESHNFGEDLDIVLECFNNLIEFSKREDKRQYVVIELVDEKVLAVHLASDISAACRLGGELAVANGFEDEHHVEDCLANEEIFYISNYSVQIKPLIP